MGPSESPTRHPENQEARRRKQLTRRPRRRRCLLKGCEQRFRPQRGRERYCSEGCRGAARKWSRWKAQEKYRATRAGKQKRNGQSRRYRKRVQNRKLPEKEAVPETARVIPKKFFSMAAATGLAAMSASCGSLGRRCNGSARRRAGVRWSACGSGSGAGDGGAPVPACSLGSGHGSGIREAESYPEMSLPY
jgi:hypothetical protein